MKGETMDDIVFIWLYILKKVHKCYLIVPKWILDEVKHVYIGFVTNFSSKSNDQLMKK
jgi:hypothetical protein